MEVLSCHSAPSCHIVSSRAKLVEKSLGSHRLKLLSATKQKSFCVLIKSEWGCLKYSNVSHFHLKSLTRNQASRLSNALKGFPDSDPSVLSESYNSYVTDGEGGLRNLTGTGKSIPKVQIPGLPDESDCNCGAQVSSCFWEWKPKLTVHYEKSGSENVNSPPVLLLPGFGVGSFHYEKQLRDLGRDYRVWAMDFLGQGMSLPREDPTPHFKDGGIVEKNFVWGFGDETEPWANELVYSIDLWQDQVRYFIEEVSINNITFSLSLSLPLSLSLNQKQRHIIKRSKGVQCVDHQRITIIEWPQNPNQSSKIMHKI